MARTGWCATVLLVFACTACSEQSQDPVPTATPSERRNTSTFDDVVTSADLADMEAEYGGQMSVDTTQAGLGASFYLEGFTDDGPQICRDHFRPIHLRWDGGWGLMEFHLDPPLLFHSYRPGTFRDRRRLTWRRAIYETIEESRATDPAGNVWRFSGRYNALCRAGQLDIGPVVFGGQIVVSQNPIDLPQLVRVACAGGGGGGDPAALISSPDYDPYSRLSTGGCSGGGESGGSGTPYQPGDHTGGETVSWGSGAGNGGTSACGADAVVEYVCIDYWVDGVGWVEWGCGYVTTC